MLRNSRDSSRPTSETERVDLESLIREDYERCHPAGTLEDMKRRSVFSPEDKGLLRDWMAMQPCRQEKYCSFEGARLRERCQGSIARTKHIHEQD